MQGLAQGMTGMMHGMQMQVPQMPSIVPSPEGARRIEEVHRRQAQLNRPLTQLKKEQDMIRRQVNEEFHPWDHDDPVAREMHAGHGIDHVFGGAMSSAPQEHQLVEAWRPTPTGEWQMGTGVIHRVHHEEQTLTVQFLPDQHRCRLPFSSVKPILDITPVYPTIRLAQGERLPTPSEIEARERQANAFRMTQGVAPDAPLPGAEDHEALRPGEHKGAHGTPAISVSRWGIPAPTLDALRNRSVPASRVTGVYGPHFYSQLYQNNFYIQKEHAVSASGHVDDERPHVVSHRYIPLSGPELEQNLETGTWHLTEGEGGAAPREGPGPGFLG